MKKVFIALTSLALVAGFSSCKKDNNPDPSDGEAKFLVYAETPDGGTSVYHAVSTLESGSYSIGNAFEYTEPYAEQMSNGKFYSGRLDATFTEYAYNKTTGTFAAIKTINANGFSYNPTNMGAVSDIGQNELALIETGGEYYVDENPAIPIFVADANSLTITRADSVPLNLPAGSIVYGNGFKAHGNYLVFTYVVYDANWACTDTSYAAILNRSDLSYVTTIKDTRTTSIGLYHSYHSDHASYNGDLYIASSNTNWWNANESVPAGILRIKAGETQFDPSYFVNMTQITGGNFSVYLHDLGNGKAITKVHRKDLINTYADYNGAFCVEHWVVDLASGSATKLDIPLSKRTKYSIINVGGSKYAIGANTSSGNFYYIYDSSNGSVTKGAGYVGGEIYYSARLQ